MKKKLAERLEQAEAARIRQQKEIEFNCQFVEMAQKVYFSAYEDESRTV